MDDEISVQETQETQEVIRKPILYDEEIVRYARDVVGVKDGEPIVGRIGIALCRLIPKKYDPTIVTLAFGYSCCYPSEQFDRKEGLKYARRKLSEIRNWMLKSISILMVDHTIDEENVHTFKFRNEKREPKTIRISEPVLDSLNHLVKMIKDGKLKTHIELSNQEFEIPHWVEVITHEYENEELEFNDLGYYFSNMPERPSGYKAGDCKSPNVGSIPTSGF